MRPQEIITIKRDGGELSKQQIGSFIDGVCDGSWADYQITALIMAMFTRGLSQTEQEILVSAMLNSGEVLDLSDITIPKADKHSTGGVGDKTSLIIAPVVAACGVAVPMISGRGLGHTGGTLDKLESIPGYNVELTSAEFKSLVKEVGFAMSGQTADIVPADKKLYALRDATATVEYIPLIVASIMSKKLAEGLDALILDVKTGSGAFMQKYEDSVLLAKELVSTGKAFGVSTQAMVSDMSQPLGRYVGNAFEVFECIEILQGKRGKGYDETRELSLELSAGMLVLAGVAGDRSEALKIAEETIANGSALDKFFRNCESQGGDRSICTDPKQLLDHDLYEHFVRSETDGNIAEVNARSIGEAIVSIGGGRIKAEDEIDHAVGFACEAKIGDQINAGDTLGILYCRSKEQADSISEKLTNAYKISEQKVSIPKLIKAII